LKPGYHKNWSLQRDNIIEDFNLELELINSNVGCWSFYLSDSVVFICNHCKFHTLGVSEESDATIKNSTFWSISIDFESGDIIEIDNFERGYIESSNLYDVYHNKNFIIENSTVINGWDFHSSGSELKINNSNMNSLVMGENLNSDIINVSNSSIERLRIGGESEFSSHGILTFYNVSIKSVDAPINSFYNIFGTVSFEEQQVNTDFSPWLNSILFRDFPILILDSSGLPMKNVYLELHSSNDELIWSGSTDNDGKTSFDLSFNYENFYDTLILTSDCDTEKPRDIRFLTYTTIVIAPPNNPIIYGITDGKVGESYNFTFYSSDPGLDDLFYCLGR